MTFERQILLALFVAIVPFVSTGHERSQQVPSKKELMNKLLTLNDALVETQMQRQLTTGDRYAGAVLDADSVVSPIQTSHFIQTLMCSYVSPRSRYYRSPELLKRMTLAAHALVELQHEDGTIDLVTTNFHSTPDLGFTIFPLAVSYSIMRQNKELSFGDLTDPMKKYLLKAGDALSVGGIHTPNHRWVVSAALAWLHSFFEEPKYKARIDQWLAEKVDIDPDGQYHERSTAIYTPVTNLALLDIARKVGYTQLYDVVRKNLDMTLYFVHANGEIVTESSRRQDKYLRNDMSKYFNAYNQLALLDNDGRYAAMVEYIMTNVPTAHLLYMLPLFIENPAQLKDLPPAAKLPVRYHKHFKHSDMVRIREEEVDMSIITDNSTFFTFFKGTAALEGMRLSSAFFGKGQFISQKLEKDGDTYILTSTMEGPYYQPLPKEKLPTDGHGWSIPRTERKQSEVQTLFTKVSITPQGASAVIRVEVQGPENLPVALELGFRSGGTLQNVTPKNGLANAFLSRNGAKVVYRNGTDTITVGPGRVAHKWVQLRGALPKLDADCVFLTAYAPCTFEFTIQ
ncbi:MAG TPA: hypothetical protein VFT90_17920 [Chryseosolibacter sp.]|nr:hypothetical protein [Chryseosolibacter sp.]